MAVWTSLSPLPLKFKTTLAPSDNVGQRFSRWANAWDVSNAGIIPSNRDTLLNATHGRDQYKKQCKFSLDVKETYKDKYLLKLL